MYLNGYGNVPERDDVRFDLAIKEAPIPGNWAIPRDTDYPGMVEGGTSDTATLIRERGTKATSRLLVLPIAPKSAASCPRPSA